ncbi:hypothetical protein NDU88_011392 [Pleurodeles waltl]|uniref:Reverse transcriptase domain-containing protein n=1 Tax=Pleurodeles waltl TaxID=8319 RepID=A0AAV7S594_PLEWA|nr:hypothetical protein NDU88_011392 [Pleurodeles waltl]
MPHLLETLQESRNNGLQPPSIREAQIKMLLNPGRDLLDSSSYRPKSMQDFDTKFQAKALARHLGGVVTHLVHDAQFSFIAGSGAQITLWRLPHVLHSVAGMDLAAVVVALDTEKVFDTLGLDYLWEMLQWMGLGLMFLWCIQLLYAHLWCASTMGMWSLNACLLN